MAVSQALIQGLHRLYPIFEIGSQAQPPSYATLDYSTSGDTILSRINKAFFSPPMRALHVFVIVQILDLTIFPWVLAGSLCTAGIAYFSWVLEDGLYKAIYYEYFYYSFITLIVYFCYITERYAFDAVLRIVGLLRIPILLVSLDGVRDVLVISCWFILILLDHRTEQFVAKFLLKAIEAIVLAFGGLFTISCKPWDFVSGSMLRHKSNTVESQDSRYQYSMLAEGEIRLLLLPRRASFSPIKVKMITVKLQDAPSYEAISYTWGTSKQTREMVVNHKKFTTSIAAYEVLDGWSSIWRSRLIWIDYLCINQHDLEEKASQVTQMIDIYRKAKRVIVWLKKFDFDITTYNALEMMHIIFLALETGRSTTQITQGLMIHTAGPRWQAFLEVFGHAWFSRVWVVQEAAVAQNLFFSYAGVLFPWKTVLHLSKSFLLTDLLVFLQHTPQANRVLRNLDNLGIIQTTRWSTLHNQDAGVINKFRDELDHNNHPVLQKLYDATVALHHKAYGSSLNDNGSNSSGGLINLHRIPFAHLMTAYGNFLATDARDKVYALRGLATDSLTSNTAPNYTTRSVEALYTNLAETIWKSDDPFGIVGWAGIGRPRALDIPSFVPDWTCPPTPAVPLTAACFGSEETFRYKASGDTRPSVRFVLAKEWPVVELDGALIDYVKALSSDGLPVQENGQEDGLKPDNRLMRLKVWHDEVKALITKHFIDRGTGDLYDTLWRTLVCDRKEAVRPAPPEMREEYEAWLEFLRIVDNGSSWDPTRSAITERKIVEFMEKHSNSSWARWMGGGCVGRRFGMTEQGRSGLFPPFTKLGDPIFIAYGAATPWVLRPTIAPGLKTSNPPPMKENNYLLVGECYVHGIMDGEAIKPGQQVDHIRVW